MDFSQYYLTLTSIELAVLSSTISINIYTRYFKPNNIILSIHNKKDIIKIRYNKYNE